MNNDGVDIDAIHRKRHIPIGIDQQGRYAAGEDIDADGYPDKRFDAECTIAWIVGAVLAALSAWAAWGLISAIAQTIKL